MFSLPKKIKKIRKNILKKSNEILRIADENEEDATHTEKNKSSSVISVKLHWHTNTFKDSIQHSKSLTDDDTQQRRKRKKYAERETTPTIKLCCEENALRVNIRAESNCIQSNVQKQLFELFSTIITTTTTTTSSLTTLKRCNGTCLRSDAKNSYFLQYFSFRLCRLLVFHPRTKKFHRTIRPPNQRNKNKQNCYKTLNVLFVGVHNTKIKS